MSSQNIEVIARAIIENNGKILVCRGKKKNYYYFPGGHVEFGESAKEALKREIREELGLDAKVGTFVGVSEHLFTQKNKDRHEINLVFEVKMKGGKIKSKEDQLEFYFFDKKQLKQENVLPKALKEAILKWFKNETIFWVNQ